MYTPESEFSKWAKDNELDMTLDSNPEKSGRVFTSDLTEMSWNAWRTAANKLDADIVASLRNYKGVQNVIPDDEKELVKAITPVIRSLRHWTNEVVNNRLTEQESRSIRDRLECEIVDLALTTIPKEKKSKVPSVKSTAE